VIPLKKSTVICTLLGIVIILTIGVITSETERLFKMMYPTAIYYWFLIKLLYLLFGMVIEGNKIAFILNNRIFKINWLLFSLTLILIGLSLSSPWLIPWFGLGFPFRFNPFLVSEINAALTVFAGILLVRSFNGSKSQA
jgi:hypothetical protein